ncbi:unnamed protein product [Oikopleura dioica]|uniref:EF-hand domain-containing protein n=1 Tax=Oikopleura dioica TaxID=34765 RepID=E4YAC5_OIKDI|nr:unnamed protein product [Oikopleura dioica]
MALETAKRLRKLSIEKMRLFQLSRRLLGQHFKVTKHVRCVKSQGFYTKFDKDGDGEISPEEFKKIMKSSEYGDVYKQFDSDGDGDITPDELITILVKLGEVPMDLALYFNDMSSSASTEFAGVVNFLTILTNYCSMQNPAKVEQEVLQEMEEFAQGNETINKEQLQDWLFKIHPEFDDDLLEVLAEARDSTDYKTPKVRFQKTFMAATISKLTGDEK